MIQDACLEMHERTYSQRGLNAQRRYPNEELCRYIGMKFFSTVPHEERKKTKILEIGCGSGANLWMLAKEGFTVAGLDFSPTALALAQDVVDPFLADNTCELKEANMLATGYPDETFDIVLDVFSACCFTHHDYCTMIGEVSRILKKGGEFFFFTPCITSKAFTDHAPSTLLDPYTLDGIRRKDSPYVGNVYPFHFLDATIADDLMAQANLHRVSLKRVTRTHHDLDEPFSHLVGVYQKQ